MQSVRDSKGVLWAYASNATKSVYYLLRFDGLLWQVDKNYTVQYNIAWPDNYGNVWLSSDATAPPVSWPSSPGVSFDGFFGNFGIPGCFSGGVTPDTSLIYDRTGQTLTFTVINTVSGATLTTVPPGTSYKIRATPPVGSPSDSPTYNIASLTPTTATVYAGPANPSIPADDSQFIYTYVNYTCSGTTRFSDTTARAGAPTVTRVTNLALPVGQILTVTANQTFPNGTFPRPGSVTTFGASTSITGNVVPVIPGLYTTLYTSNGQSRVFGLRVVPSLTPHLVFYQSPSAPVDLANDEVVVGVDVQFPGVHTCDDDDVHCAYHWSSPQIPQEEFDELNVFTQDADEFAGFDSESLKGIANSTLFNVLVTVTVTNLTTSEQLYVVDGAVSFRPASPLTPLLTAQVDASGNVGASTKQNAGVQFLFAYAPLELGGNSIFMPSFGSSPTADFVLPTGKSILALYTVFPDGSTKTVLEQGDSPIRDVSNPTSVSAAVTQANNLLSARRVNEALQWLYVAVKASDNTVDNQDLIYNVLVQASKLIDTTSEDFIEQLYTNNFLIVLDGFTNTFVNIDNSRLATLLIAVLGGDRVSADTGKYVFNVISSVIKQSDPSKNSAIPEYFDATAAIFDPLNEMLRKVATNPDSVKKGGTQYNTTSLSCAVNTYDVDKLKGKTITNGLANSDSAQFTLPNNVLPYGNATKASAVMYTLKYNPFFAYLPSVIKTSDTMLTNVAGLTFYGDNGTEINVKPLSEDKSALFTIRIPISKQMIELYNKGNRALVCLYWNSTHRIMGNDGMSPELVPVIKDGYVNCTSNHLTNFTVAMYPTGSSSTPNIGLLVGLPVAAAVLVGGVLGGSVYYVRRKSAQYRRKRREDEELMEANRQATNFQQIKPDAIQVLMRIGGGAFGDVYKGLYLGTTEVALKKLSEGAGQDVQEEFQQEAAMLQRLLHPNVTQFLGIWVTTEGEQYMVSEFMSKGSLLSVLRDPNERPTIDDILSMCQETAAGMNYLSDRAIVHRDLAARNLLVRSEGRRYVVKVTDFGMSRQTEQNNEHIESKSNKFPVKWSAPEILSDRKYTSKSDVWAFGIVMWEVFEYGKIPYPDMNNAEASQRVMEGYRLPCPRDCPPEIYDIMLQCWQHRSEDRPSFKQLFQKLSDLLKNRGRLDQRYLESQQVPVEEPAPRQLYNNDENLYSIDDKARASVALSPQQIYNSKNVVDIPLSSGKDEEPEDIYAFSDKSVQRASHRDEPAYQAPVSVSPYASPAEDIYSFSDTSMQRASQIVASPQPESEDIYAFADDARRNSTLGVQPNQPMPNATNRRTANGTHRSASADVHRPSGDGRAEAQDMYVLESDNYATQN